MTPARIALLAIALSRLRRSIDETVAEIIADDASPPDAAEPEAAGRGRPSKMPAVDGGLAIIPVEGSLSERKYRIIRQQFDLALASPEVGGIILNIDSPGGTVYGVSELARHIRDNRGAKPIVAIANPAAFSAAYYIGSQADKFAVTPSGEAGSIGVIAVHFDFSKMLEMDGVKATIIKAGRHKAHANPLEPLSDEDLAFEQGRVDDYYRDFVNDVAAGRGVDRATVLSDFGEGLIFGARQAVALGMADRVASFETVVGEMADQRRGRQRRATRLASVRRRRRLADLQSAADGA